MVQERNRATRTATFSRDWGLTYGLDSCSMVYMIVPASTHIRTRSLPHVDDDRLMRRQGFLATFNVAQLESRLELRMLARETINVENELERRGVAFIRRTPRFA